MLLKRIVLNLGPGKLAYTLVDGELLVWAGPQWGYAPADAQQVEIPADKTAWTVREVLIHHIEGEAP